MIKRRMTLYCSFCGKSENEVQALVSGPMVFICDECIVMAAGVVEDIKKRKIADAVKASMEPSAK